MPKATFEGILNLTEAEWEQKKKEIEAFQNCAVCDTRLVLDLCHYREDKYYCEEHCTGHVWKSTTVYPTTCTKCGLSYANYLEQLLDTNKIHYLKY